MIKQIIIVGIGGAAGSVLRYLSYVFTSRYYSNAFPLSTFGVNVLGCLLIGLFIGFIERSTDANPHLRLLLITGFCGGFTTFSAFSLENISLMQAGNYSTAMFYIVGSILAGVAAVWLGLMLSKI
jgi:CrcB protein